MSPFASQSKSLYFIILSLANEMQSSFLVDRNFLRAVQGNVDHIFKISTGNASSALRKLIITCNKRSK